MTVARILADKGTSVATVSPDRSLGDVIHIWPRSASAPSS